MKNKNRTHKKSNQTDLKTNRSLKIISYIILFILASMVILFLAVSLSPKTYGGETENNVTSTSLISQEPIELEPTIVEEPVSTETVVIETKPVVEDIISTEPDIVEPVEVESTDFIEAIEPTEPVVLQSMTEKEVIESYVDEICTNYTNVDRFVVLGVIWRESRFDPNARNYNETCIGLMQLSTRWNRQRVDKLGVSDLMDPYGNILVGVDLLSELIDKYEDISYALMCYHGGEDYGRKKWRAGTIDSYTKDILKYAESLREGD